MVSRDLGGVSSHTLSLSWNDRVFSVGCLSTKGGNKEGVGKGGHCYYISEGGCSVEGVSVDLKNYLYVNKSYNG